MRHQGAGGGGGNLTFWGYSRDLVFNTYFFVYVLSEISWLQNLKADTYPVWFPNHQLLKVDKFSSAG